MNNVMGILIAGAVLIGLCALALYGQSRQSRQPGRRQRLQSVESLLRDIRELQEAQLSPAARRRLRIRRRLAAMDPSGRPADGRSDPAPLFVASDAISDSNGSADAGADGGGA